MKVLMVNNRLKVYGGEGTYMTSLGDELSLEGHDVQYFGLKDQDDLHGNRYGIYAKKSKNPFKLLKNNYNRKQFAKILDLFKPDIIHIHLIYFTLTPSILLEAKKRNIKVIQTIHDGKIVCPSYQLYIKNENIPCTLCINGDFKNCVRHKCHKNSLFLSYIAYKEAVYNRKKCYYNLIDKFVFPSSFMKKIHLEFGIPEDKTVVLKNFSRIEKINSINKSKEPYVLFFGRVTRIKGIHLIIEAARKLPNIKFKIVGNGEMIEQLVGINNIEVLGFKSGEDLKDVISKARLSVFPSICYENCPMSIQESLALGTPVVGSNLGGIPELINIGENGFVFKPNDVDDFVDKIVKIYNNNIFYSSNCLSSSNLIDINNYTKDILKVYYEQINS